MRKLYTVVQVSCEENTEQDQCDDIEEIVYE